MFRREDFGGIEKAVAAIENAGGWVHYDYAWEGTHGNPGLPRKPWAPWWLVAVIGVDCFGQVTEADVIEQRQAFPSLTIHR